MPVYTRFLTAADYGITGTTAAVIAVLTLIMPLGLHGSISRFWFSGKDRNTSRAEAGTIVIMLIAGAAVISVALDRLGAPLFLRLFEGIPFDPYLRLGIWIAFFNVISYLPLIFFQVNEKPVHYVVFSAGSSIVAIALTLWFVVVERGGARGYLFAQFLGGVLVAIPSLCVVARYIRLSFDRAVARTALLFAIPLVPHALATWVLDLSDRAILARYVSLADIGIYSVGYQVGAATSLAVTAISNAWTPMFFKTLSEEGAAAHSRISRMATYYAIAVCFGGLGLAILAKPILALMVSASFQEARTIAPWVAAGCVLNGLYIVPANFLFWASKTRVVPMITIAAGTFNVLLNILLVPRLGIVAAAIATLVSYGLMLVFAWFAAQRVYRFPYEYGRIAAVVLAAVVVFFVGIHLPASSSAAVQAAARTGWWLAYPLLLAALGLIARSDLASVHASTAVKP